MNDWPATVGALAAAIGVLVTVGGRALRPLSARLGRIEQQTQLTAAELPKLDAQLGKLAVVAESNAERVEHLEQRITDHRRRNDEQAELLREALARRNEIVDKRLDRLQRDLLQLPHPKDDS